jgi:hypothetical protein
MACNSIKKMEYDACQPNIGGIKNVWLANYVENAATITETADKLVEG